nr:MAG TPA: hypothetical protein [Caudoviricetes sp.]
MLVTSFHANSNALKRALHAWYGPACAFVSTPLWRRPWSEVAQHDLR